MPAFRVNGGVATRSPDWLRGHDACVIGDRGLVTGPDNDLLRFIASSFRSVWALELLLLLKRERRAWTRHDLVAAMRSSELVVSHALDSLVAAGLVVCAEEGASYMPVNDEVANCVEQLEKLYAARPDSVRRVIVSASSPGATAFADAFRFRKD